MSETPRQNSCAEQTQPKQETDPNLLEVLGGKEEEERMRREKLKDMIKKWHDDVKPDYVFLDETRATPYGYLFKEAWKAAYPDEDTPRFYRIDPRFVGGDYHPKEKFEAWKEYFAKRIKKPEAKIIVFDEESNTGKTPLKVRSALIGTTWEDRYGLERKGSRKSIPAVKIDNIYIEKSTPYLQNILGSGLMTERKGVFGSNFTAGTQKDPEKRKHALEGVKLLKQIGKEIGVELRAEFVQERGEK